MIAIRLIEQLNRMDNWLTMRLLIESFFFPIEQYLTLNSGHKLNIQIFAWSTELETYLVLLIGNTNGKFVEKEEKQKSSVIFQLYLIDTACYTILFEFSL
jgi:hypothetical protein